MEKAKIVGLTKAEWEEFEAALARARRLLKENQGRATAPTLFDRQRGANHTNSANHATASTATKAHSAQ
jgi:hypothetical protein